MSLRHENLVASFALSCPFRSRPLYRIGRLAVLRSLGGDRVIWYLQQPSRSRRDNRSVGHETTGPVRRSHVMEEVALLAPQIRFAFLSHDQIVLVSLHGRIGYHILTGGCREVKAWHVSTEKKLHIVVLQWGLQWGLHSSPTMGVTMGTTW